MAEIDIERKKGMGIGWLWWVLGLILLAVIIWWIAASGDDDEEVVMEDPIAAPVVTEPMAPAAPTAPGIAEVLANPSAFVGQSFSTDTVRVAEVVGDRGFWIEGDAGERLFVVKNESPQEGRADVEGQPDVRAARDVNTGDQLQISGTLLDGGDLDAVQPPLDAATRQALTGQPIFLQANVADIQHIG